MKEDNSFFFNNLESSCIEKITIDNLKAYAINNQQQIYLINKPLSEKKYDYTVNKVLIFLCPGYNIQFVNLNLREDEFEEIYEDFIEDLGHMADKYNYTQIISRPRKWRKFIQKNNLIDFKNHTVDEAKISGFFNANKLTDDLEKRTTKLLISLLTGSINSAEKVGTELPKSVLEKVKKNIILFDGDQTRFIFGDSYDDKVIKIQGLAGTGKTELLLHRLKEIYVMDKDVKIAFTCQSKTLANKLKNRITDFFNFMKVEEQIEWNKRLWVMHAWGSVRDIFNTGTYGMICRMYKLPFYTPGNESFSSACKKTLDYINDANIDIKPFFDYMLIDEGQDFSEEFIKLCSMVTKNKVFVAGDIFQDIFGIQKIEAHPHYLLNKCYRTDPRTLMFSHALGLGLYEKPSIRFLKDKEWKACGYKFEKKDGNYILEREPVKRFEDIDSLTSQSSIKIIDYIEYNTNDIINIILKIKEDFPDVNQEDIAIVFPNEKLNYKKIDELELLLYSTLGWKSNLLYNTKETNTNAITISNKNNIKGLEFPFVICIADYEVTRDFKVRNTLYMTLTRSFISSYLLIQKSVNNDLIQILNSSLEQINLNLQMIIPEPSDEEKRNQQSIIEQYNKPLINQFEVLNEIFKELKVNKSETPAIKEAVSRFRTHVTDKDNLTAFVKTLMGSESNE